MIVRTRLAPKNYCLNLFGLYLTRDTSWITPRILNHERIHDAQQRELLFIPFYLLYGLEWLWLLLKLRNSRKAYRAISFEREAYANDHDPAYLSRRKHFANYCPHCW